MRRIQLIPLALLAGLLLLATPASAAQKCGGQTNGEGNSGLDQYAETIPGSCDDQPLGGGNGDGESGSGGGGGGGNVLPAETAAELESLGADGQAAAALANATAPDTDGNGGNGSGAGSGNGDGNGGAGGPAVPLPVDAADANDASGLAAVIAALLGDSDEGVGWALPLIMLASLITVVAVALRRRS